MGCDIHLFAEAKIKRSFIERLKFWVKPKWTTIDVWELDEDYIPPRIIVPYEKRTYTGGRNYNLFTALCGVRSGHFYGESPMLSEPKGLPDDCCDEIRRESELWDGDGHSHSFNTLKELKEFDWSPYGDTVSYFLNEVIPKLELIGVDDEDVRIVYFFDN